MERQGWGGGTCGPNAMCGIAGVIKVWRAEEQARALATPPTQAIPERWLDVLDEAVLHRGPDGQGRFRDRAVRADGCVVDVALVHRRLSILDHAGGMQPMVSVEKERGVITGTKRWIGAPGLGLYERDAAELGAWEPVAAQMQRGDARDTVAVVFNGCIYNHRELRAELQRTGHVFRTDHSDTEVLVHGAREWGDGLFTKLDGMFTSAIWDAQAGELLVMRDRFGEKPLFVLERAESRRGDGSELVALCSSAAGLIRLERAVAPEVWGVSKENGTDSALASWLGFGWSRGSIPGTHVRAMPNQWVIPYGRKAPGRETGVVETGDWRADARPFHNAENVEQELRNAVGTRLESDVPLGCFLSGGVDSSLVARFARDHLGRLETFTVRIPDSGMDESGFAAQAAKIIGSNHTVVDVHPNPAEDLRALVHEVGVPFGDSSLLPAMWVSRAARGLVKVALSGDGGDELFFGYERQAAWYRLRAIGSARHAAMMLRSARPFLPARLVRSEKWRRLMTALSLNDYRELVMIFQTPELRAICGPIASVLEASEMDARRAGDGAALPWNVFDAECYLPGDLMMKSDTASMHSALEVRSPMLSRAFARRAMATSIRRRLPLGQRKGLLREVARKHFPTDLVDRKKMGFAIPVGEWFRSDFGGMRSLLLDYLQGSESFGPSSQGIDLDAQAIREMLNEHLGTGKSGLITRDHSQRLYMLLVLSIWAKWLGALGK